MSDEMQDGQQGPFVMAGTTMERAAFGGVLFAMVVFGLFKDLLG